jgi:hypothetical protein
VDVVFPPPTSCEKHGVHSVSQQLANDQRCLHRQNLEHACDDAMGVASWYMMPQETTQNGFRLYVTWSEIHNFKILRMNGADDDPHSQFLSGSMNNEFNDNVLK